MTKQTALPLVYTAQQRFDMCEQALRDASKCRHDAALARGQRPRIVVHGDMEQQARIDTCNAEAAELEDKAVALLATAQEHAEALVGSTVILTGTIHTGRYEWQSGTPGLIGSGHDEWKIFPLEVEGSKRTISRVEANKERFSMSTSIYYYFEFNKQQYYFTLPAPHGADLQITFDDETSSS